MPDGEFFHVVEGDENAQTRERLRDVFSAFEKLERELRQHIEQLRLSQIPNSVPDHITRTRL
jgi:hypothetical protein